MADCQRVIFPRVRAKPTIGQHQKDIAMVVARLKDHDSKIERVSDEIAASKPTRQVVLSTPHG